MLGGECRQKRDVSAMHVQIRRLRSVDLRREKVNYILLFDVNWQGLAIERTTVQRRIYGKRNRARDRKRIKIYYFRAHKPYRNKRDILK